MNQLTILVCLYNTNLHESYTLQSLFKVQNINSFAQIVIWDNSVIKLDKQSILKLESHFKKIVYKHTPQNTPLSVIYNTVIENQTNPLGYLMICDDDSKIPVDFFESLKSFWEKNKTINLFLPIIYSNNVIVSPAKNYLIKAKLFKNLKPGIIPTRNLNAINSCMVISNRVFIDGFRYDERLQFYGTDTFFMSKFIQKYKSLVVLNQIVIHDLSFNTSKSIEDRVRIFKQIKKSNSIIYSHSLLKNIIVYFNTFIVSVRYSLKYKTTAFLYD